MNLSAMLTARPNLKPYPGARVILKLDAHAPVTKDPDEVEDGSDEPEPDIDQHIFALLERRGNLTLVDIAALSGYSLPKCKRAVHGMLQRGVLQSERIERGAHLLSVAPGGRYKLMKPRSSADRIVEAVRSLGQPRAPEIAKELDLTEPYTRGAVAALVRDGRLRRYRSMGRDGIYYAVYCVPEAASPQGGAGTATGQIIEYVETHSNYTVGEVARETAASTSQVYRVLARLCKKQVLTRKKVEHEYFYRSRK